MRVKKPSRNKFILRYNNDSAQIIGSFDTLGEVVSAVIKYNLLHVLSVRYAVKKGWITASEPYIKWWYLVVEDHYYMHSVTRVIYILTKENGMLMRSSDERRTVNHQRYWSMPAATTPRG